ncbi:hypothetical protein PVK06_007109 [Gossypium arboreum]|uniref:DUF4283 domain-containing protein n=1 Tax=Gossypium arboreum TaxID=29729 RepID=A0ABR0QGF1_GOSAR|nr:hypothetical protein PVK06_007109 [Gossypium arboreum]
MQRYPSVVLTWIQLPNPPGHLYKWKIIGKMVKLDLQTNNQTIGHFARLVVYINLDRPLISKIYVDEATQQVEYEALPTVCFMCGKYRHAKDLCTSVMANQKSADLVNTENNPREESTIVEGPFSAECLNGKKYASIIKGKGPKFGP